MSECDRDISDIKNGTKNIQKRKLSKRLQDQVEDEAFDAFMEIFHPSKNIRIPTDEDYITGMISYCFQIDALNSITDWLLLSSAIESTSL